MKKHFFLSKENKVIIKNIKHMKIDPIPVEELRFYDWFSSPNHKNWFYYRPRRNADFNPVNLNNTLDENIKKINVLLTKNNFKTLPSCEGHNRSDDFVKKVFENLMNDAKLIRTKGLVLQNCENDNLYFLYDPNWNIPFDFEELKDEIGVNSKVRGYIGFFTNDKKLIQNCIDILNDLGSIECRYKKGALEILNLSPNKKERNNNWKAVYDILNVLLN